MSDYHYYSSLRDKLEAMDKKIDKLINMQERQMPKLGHEWYCPQHKLWWNDAVHIACPTCEKEQR